MSTDAPLAAVILAWNNATDTIACVGSVLDGTLVPDRILVIDNGSTDGSDARLEAGLRSYPAVEFHRNESNLGFSGGVNRGIERALALGATRIFLLNNDTELSPDCLALLDEALSRDAGVGIAGPMILYHSRPGVIWQAGGTFSRLRAGVSVALKNRPAAEVPSEAVDAGFLTGCAMLVRREVFERVGTFDESLFFYSEDLDLSLRARAAGYRLLLVPAARMTHKIDDISKDRATPFVLYHRARSSLAVVKNRFSPLSFAYAVAIHLVLYTPYRLIQAFRSGTPVASFAAWLRGTMDGIFRPRAPRRY